MLRRDSSQIKLSHPQQKSSNHVSPRSAVAEHYIPVKALTWELSAVRWAIIFRPALQQIWHQALQNQSVIVALHLCNNVSTTLEPPVVLPMHACDQTSMGKTAAGTAAALT